MSASALITYYVHSGFSVAINGILLLFDYWLGRNGELPVKKRITREFLQTFRAVFVFVTHKHMDHLDPIIYQWKDLPNITYILGKNAPRPDDGVPRRPQLQPIDAMATSFAPGDSMQVSEEVLVSAFDSTDEGVSFLVQVGERTIFHAGDLNFWHWREESTLKEIEEAEDAFRRAVAPLTGAGMEICFFPLDPRQGRLYDAGANYFIMTAKPKILIPMHFWGRGDVAISFARQGSTRDTEVLAMTRMGEEVAVTFADDGRINARFLTGHETHLSSEETGLPLDEAADAPIYHPDDPFLGTDQPIQLDE